MLTASLALLAVLGPGGQIVYRPTARKSHTYVLQQTFSDPGDDFRLETWDRITVKTLRISPAGEVENEVSILATRERLDGVERPIAKDAKPLVLRERRRRDGSLVFRDEIPSDPVLGHRYARLFSIVYPQSPLEKGKGWKVESNQVGEASVPAATQRFEVRALQKSPPGIVIEFWLNERGIEHPFAAHGLAEIEAPTGLIKTMTGGVENAVVSGSEGQIVRLDFTLRREGDPVLVPMGKPSGNRGP